MYKIVDGDNELLTCPTLAAAMQFARAVGTFITIKGPDFEVCGIFGVDSVKNGMTPDGHVYDWDKSSRIGRVKKENM